MPGIISTEAIAVASVKRPWITVGIWVTTVVVSMALTVMLLGGALTTNAEVTNNPESESVVRLSVMEPTD